MAARKVTPRAANRRRCVYRNAARPGRRGDRIRMVSAAVQESVIGTSRTFQPYPRLSAIGPKRTSNSRQSISAFGARADIASAGVTPAFDPKPTSVSYSMSYTSESCRLFQMPSLGQYNAVFRVLDSPFGGRILPEKESHNEAQICAADWNLGARSVDSPYPDSRSSGLRHGRGTELSAAEENHQW